MANDQHKCWNCDETTVGGDSGGLDGDDSDTTVPALVYEFVLDPASAYPTDTFIAHARSFRCRR